MRSVAPILSCSTFHVEVERGIFVLGDLSDYVVFWCFVHGYDRDPIVRLSRALISPGDTVLDVGANIGLWSMGAANRAGKRGSVHAFEPVPENFDRLKHHLSLNSLKNVACVQKAVGANDGVSIFYTATNGNSGMGSLAPMRHVDGEIRVAVTTLDSYAAEAKIARVDFLKLDIEGGELGALRGASRILRGVEGPAILFEADDLLAMSNSSSVREVKTLLHDQGYSVFRLVDRALKAVPIKDAHEHEDLFGLRPYHLCKHPWLRNMLRQR